MKTWKRLPIFEEFRCTDQDLSCGGTIKQTECGIEIRISGLMAGAHVVVIDDLEGASAHKAKIRARKLINKIEWDKRG